MTKPADTKPDAAPAPEPKHPAFTAYADDATVVTIGGLSVENGTDAIAIHGNLDLLRDRTGLERARTLRQVAEAIVAALEAGGLPEDAPQAASGTRTVANPFA